VIFKLHKELSLPSFRFSWYHAKVILTSHCASNFTRNYKTTTTS